MRCDINPGKRAWSGILLGLLLLTSARAGDLAFSDPANTPPLPPWAIGFPSRDPNLDALPGFTNPPPGYGEVAFYWWLGDPLTKERLTWQMDQLAGKGVMGLQINYAHSDQGGRTWGLTYPSDPPLFSEAWWNLTSWFMQEAKKRGMAISLSDYTLGVGQGWCVDEILKEHPELNGSVLSHVEQEAGAGEVRLKLTGTPLMAAAYNLTSGAVVDLRQQVADGTLNWSAPEGRWRVVAVCAGRVLPSIDPMNPLSGPEYAKKFFGRWEEHNPGEGGKGLNFFFSDELDFQVSGNLWTDRLAEEFRKRKGYDLVPELPALFVDIGPRTPKVRLDYRDVMVALTEESFFKPNFDWHQSRGMIYGSDHGGRGRNIVEFGDYFRTQRWMNGTGNDQPGLASDLIKTKVNSSIVHLYNRARVWLEGYYSSGWGTSSEEVADATFRNFAQGHTLLTLHGLYYSTHGGWWEWAPPCNHFRMPYWNHMGEFLKCVERLSYVLSQGHHRCDAAILYPVAAIEAGMDGETANNTAFRAAEELYRHGIDIDFMDFESLDRATIQDKELQVSGERYRVLILPSMRAVRWSTLQKAAEFQRAGGTVVIVGAAPEASDRAGRDDAELNALVRQLTTRVATPQELPALITQAFTPDFAVGASVKEIPYFAHRQLGSRDVFLVYGLPKDSECSFRATGAVELWEPWTGQTRSLRVRSQTAQGTRLALPLTAKEPQLIVFSPGKAEVVATTPQRQAAIIPVAGDWEFELKPTCDNRFGDYRWPPANEMLGAEVRQFQYTEGDGTNGPWRQVTSSFGPQFWKLGPVPDNFDEATLIGMGKPDSRWQPYEFSWRWGIENDPGHQGYHGLKEQVHDEFIALGKPRQEMATTAYEKEAGGSRYYLWTAVDSEREQDVQARIGGLKPSRAWLNGQPDNWHLKAGSNMLLLRYDGPGRSSFVLETEAARADWKQPLGLAMSWYNKPGVLSFDTRPGEPRPAGWYRFTAPPGLRRMTLTVRGQVRAWINQQEVPVKDNQVELAAQLQTPVPVLLRVEQDRGCYGGAAIPEPIKLECGRGRITAGDWGRIDGLASYSGGAWYRKTVTLTAEQAASMLTLDLGGVTSSAEVRVNGQPAGIRLTPPWQFDCTRLAKPGENQIEVLVYNTLANHYSTIPTRYRHPNTSGLLGPVQIESRNK